jgi:hypothetical protein
MSTPKKLPAKLLPWLEARRKFGLSDATVQMARELGLNPNKLGKLVPATGQAWKTPLPEFIATCYERSHGRRMPEKVRSLEQIAYDEEQRKQARKDRRATKPGQSSPVAQPGTSHEQHEPRDGA